MSDFSLGINAAEANVERRVGSNVYAYHVLCELERLSVNDDVTVYLPTPPVADLPKERDGWNYRVIPPAKFWTQWRLPMDLYLGIVAGRHHDVFYSLGHYAPRLCPFPSVVSVMDLAFLKFPQYFQKRDALKLTAWTRYSVEQAAHVIAISEHTKKDVLNEYKIAEDRITVAHPGYEPVELIGSSKTMVRQLGITSPYIIYVGTIQPRKNVPRLIKAFELLRKKKENANLLLVIAGKPGWMTDEFTKAVQHSGAKSHIRTLGFVTEEQKLALYSEAKAAVLVGLYEGFGIPPLEAMSAGTVPVVSNTASLPEVVGEAGVIVDPYDVRDIARGIGEVLDFTPRQREQMLTLGRRRLERFRWSDTGGIIYRVLREAGGKG